MNLPPGARVTVEGSSTTPPVFRVVRYLPGETEGKPVGPRFSSVVEAHRYREALIAGVGYRPPAGRV